jgi:hypothetical protein
MCSILSFVQPNIKAECAVATAAPVDATGLVLPFDVKMLMYSITDVCDQTHTARIRKPDLGLADWTHHNAERCVHCSAVRNATRRRIDSPNGELASYRVRADLCL